MIELEEKCRELEGVVEDMTNTLVDFSDSLIKCGNTNPEMARGLKETMKKFLALSEKAARDPWEEKDGSPEHSDEQPVLEGVVEDTESSSQTVADVSQSRELSAVPFFETTPVLLNPSGTLQAPLIYGQNITDFDPYANYSIWGLPP